MSEPDVPTTEAAEGAGATSKDKRDICPSCGSGGGRNLVICIDGTSNQFGIKNTNVVELYSRLIKDENQLTFYNSGIGTYAEPSWKSWEYFKQVVANKLDLAFALRFENIMLSAYAWLVENYQEGDRIYMFGFSRGAYQVRALAAMLDMVGLLHKGNEGQIPFAYELYAASDPMAQDEESPAPHGPAAPESTQGGMGAALSPMPPGAQDTHEHAPESAGQASLEVANPNRPETSLQSPTTAAPTDTRVFRRRLLSRRLFNRASRVAADPDPAATGHQSPTTAVSAHKGISGLLPHRLFHRTSRGAQAADANPLETSSQPPTTAVSNHRGMLLRLLPHPLFNHVSRGATVCARMSARAARIIFFLGPEDTTRPFPRPSQQTSASEDTTQPLPPNAMQKRFKDTFSREIKPHFVGAWDTVSSVGFVRDKTLPGTTDGMNQVCFFRHALAMHERRVKFLPEYVNGGAGPSAGSTKAQKGHTQPHTKEVWFTGSHSDIGGGNTANASLDKFGPALRWMSFEGVLAGLRIENGPQKWDETPRIAESMTGIWKLVECLPVKRLSYGDKDSVLSWPPHFGSQRRILPGQLVHESFFTGIPCTQEDLGLDFGVEQEDDAFKAAQALLTLPTNSSETRAWVSRLRILMQSQSGIQSLIDLEWEMMTLIGRIATLTLQDGDFEDIKGDLCLLQGVLTEHSLEAAQDWKSELKKHSRSFPLGLHGHTDIVRSVAFIDARLVVSDSDDGTLRLWNIETGETPGDPASGHSGFVICVAVSPDGSIIASGSYNCTIRTWRLDEGRLVSTGLIMSTGGRQPVYSLAFSPDGSRIVSGDGDGALHLWNATTGQPMGNTVQGHRRRVWSVAFSPDGARIASGSWDRTVRLWDARTLEQLGNHEHTARVTSVVFSPDCTSITCGIDENGICMCSMDTLEPMSTFGEDCDVRSIAFSPTGRHIAAGCYDHTVRIWDITTGGEVGVLKGHIGPVWSVAFSLDGTCIVSGSTDRSIRVWDRLPISDDQVST